MLADLVIDDELLRRARKAQDRRLALTFGLVVVVCLGFMIVQLVRHGSPDRSPSPLLYVAVLAMPLVLTVLMIGVVLLLRRRQIGMFAPSVAAGLDRGGRRAVLRAIRSGQHLQGKDEEAALDTARQLVGLRWMLVVYPLILGFTVVRALTDDLDVLGVLIVLGGLVALAALLLAWRDIRRARAYLATAPTPAIMESSGIMPSATPEDGTPRSR